MIFGTYDLQIQTYLSSIYRQIKMQNQAIITIPRPFIVAIKSYLENEGYTVTYDETNVAPSHIVLNVYKPHTAVKTFEDVVVNGEVPETTPSLEDILMDAENFTRSKQAVSRAKSVLEDIQKLLSQAKGDYGYFPLTLTIDDDPVVNRLVFEALNVKGYRVKTAPSARLKNGVVIGANVALTIDLKL